MPLFEVSSKSGTGVDLLQQYLSSLPEPSAKQEEKDCQVLITNKFIVKGSIVLGGTVLEGTLKKY